MIPEEILSAIGGAAIASLLAVIASGIRSIPFKLMIGNPNKNGKTLITADMLKANCESRQTVLDKKLDDIKTEISDNGKSLREAREEIAYIKGRVSRRSA